jgi:ribonuclease P protein component
VLPAAARLTSRDDFTLAVRHGRRAGRGTLVAYLLSPSADAGAAGAAGPDSARAGFVVGRAVGGSVARHRVIRRLRHLVRDRLPLLPAGSRLVVRALPPARDADSATLGRDLDSALTRLLAAADAIDGAPTTGGSRDTDDAAAPVPGGPTRELERSTAARPTAGRRQTGDAAATVAGTGGRAATTSGAVPSDAREVAR